MASVMLINYLLRDKGMKESIPVVDCHTHFLDADLHNYPIFSRRNPGFEALVGDYSALPRRYLAEHYLTG
jgi:hypothetical protein